MKVKTCSKVRRVAFWGAVVAAAMVFGIIFVLTEQSPAQTSSLSLTVERRVTGDPGAGDLQGDNNASGASGSAVDDIQRPPALFEYLLSIAGVRKRAHTFEFFAFGLAVASAVLLWWGRPFDIRRRAILCGMVCACGSLFDQTHKLFVPGREFDAGDLAFDILGYGSAMLLVFAARMLVKKKGAILVRGHR